MSEITQILSELEAGDTSAAERLMPLVYEELRRIAASKMRHERVGHSLAPTELVHEAFLRLVQPADAVRWENRSHFFAAAAEAMRRVLVDHARRRLADKRGGDRERVALDEFILFNDARISEVIAVDEALDRLQQEDTEAAALVTLRFFVGLTNAEAAAHLGTSPRKANMLWSFARAWLRRELAGEPE